MFEFADASGGTAPVSIKVIGVGGAGGNVVNNMIAAEIKGVEFIAVNTDAQALERSLADKRLQIGRETTRGLGAGSKPEVGHDSAMEDRALIEEALEGADMVFITAGMGGGTGTGAAPVVAEIAKTMGALTVAIVTKPFFYEGGIRKRNAEKGVANLKQHADTMIVIPNDRISHVVDKGTPILKSFDIANEVLRNAVKGISDLVLVPGLINLDFADVRTIMQEAGRAVIGMGVGKGDGAAHDAAKRAVLNQLIENSSIEGAEGIIINVTGGLGLSATDLQEASAPIYDSAREDANIIIGAVIDPDLKDEIRVTIIATRFPLAPEAKAEPVAQVPAEVQHMKKWIPAREGSAAAAAANLSLRGADRILAKSLQHSAPKQQDGKLPLDLDVPAFLRRSPQVDAARP